MSQGHRLGRFRADAAVWCQSRQKENFDRGAVSSSLLVDLPAPTGSAHLEVSRGLGFQQSVSVDIFAGCEICGHH